MSDTSDLSYVYNRQIVLSLVEKTKSCTLIWSQLGNFNFQTSTIENEGSYTHTWDFVLSRFGDNNLSYFYKLDVSLDTNPYLTLDSTSNTEVTADLTDLFQRVESTISGELEDHIEVNAFVQNIPNAGFVWDFTGLGGVIVGGHALQIYNVTGVGGVLVGGSANESQFVDIGGVIVGGSALLSYPTTSGIYTGASLSTEFLRKYNKATIDSLQGDPGGGTSDLVWKVPSGYQSGIIVSIQVGLNGYIYTTGIAQGYNTPDTWIYDSNAQEIINVTHQIDLNPGSVNKNGAAFGGIAVDSSGHFVIVGQPLGNYLVTPDNIRAVWKHDLQGNVLFSYEWGRDTNGQNLARQAVDVCMDQNDNYYIIGFTVWNGTKNVNIRKFDKNNTLIWESYLPFTLSAITTDQNYLYIVGGGTAGFIAKLDLNGNTIWTVTQELDENNITRNLPLQEDVTVGYNNLIYSCGQLAGNTTVVGGVTYYYENFVRCFNANGDRVWLSSGLRDKPIGLNSIACDGKTVYVTSGPWLALGLYDANTGNNEFNVVIPYSLFTPPLAQATFSVVLDPIDLIQIGGVLVSGLALVGGDNNEVAKGGVLVGGAAQTSDILVFGFRENPADTTPTSGHRWVKASVSNTNLILGTFVDGIPNIDDIVLDKQGNVYTVGNAYLSSLQVKKYNASGVLLWQNRISSADGCEAYSVYVDSSSNVYVSGFQSSVIAGDNMLHKYDSNGNLLLVVNTTNIGLSDFQGYHIVVDSSGDIYLGTNSSIDVLKPDGTLFWTTQAIPCNGLAIDNKNNLLYYLGTFTAPDGFLHNRLNATSINIVGGSGGWNVDLPVWQTLPDHKLLIVDNAENIWVDINDTVYKYNSSGQLLGISEFTIRAPGDNGINSSNVGLTCDIDNNVYVHMSGPGPVSNASYAYVAKILADPVPSPYFPNPILRTEYIKQIDSNPLYPWAIGSTIRQ